MMKKLKILALAISLVLVVQIDAQGVGDNAPDFTLNDLDGDSFTLSSHLGKVVFIFTFGNSCSHCIANGPNTESGIYQVYKNNSDFVAIGIDTWDGNEGQVQSYRNTTGLTYPLMLNGSSFLSAYSTGYDRMIVVDQNGVIRYKSTSDATASVVAEAKLVVSDLLSTTALESNQTSSIQLEAAYLSSQNLLRINNPFGNDGPITYRIMDMTGRILQQSKLYLSESNDIALEVPSRGLNFISLSDGQKSYTSKFIR